MESKMRYSACTLIIDPETNKILGVSRKNDHNDFGLPGGKADPDETPEECAIRETLEETGYTVNLVNTKRFVEYDKQPNSSEWEVSTFLAVIDHTVPRQEVSESETGLVKWIDPIDLMQGYFKDYNAKMLRHFGLAEQYRLICENTYGYEEAWLVTHVNKIEAIKELLHHTKGKATIIRSEIVAL